MISLSEIKCRPTFLSADVKNLLEKPEKFVEDFSDNRDYWFTSGLKINWKNVEYALDDIEEPYGNKCWFEKAVEAIAPFMSHCDFAIRGLSLEDYFIHMKPYLMWTYQEDVVSDCFKLVYSQKYEADYLLALLMITSVSERAIGNSQLFVVLLGSVYGLNLRNIAWHGFLNPREAKSSFITTIILTLVNVGQDLEVNLGPEMYIPQRLQTSFPEAEALNYVFLKMPVANRDSVEEIIIHSPLVPDVMVPVWTKILNLLDEERYGLCLTLLLPMLECSMRCLFAVVNEEATRILTAENSSFYTTFDEILQLYYKNGEAGMPGLSTRRTPEKMCVADSHSNCKMGVADENFLLKSESEKACCCKSMRLNLVPFLIGEKLNEALHDILNFVNGPRVRDKLSHGEVKLDNVPKDITYHTLYISLLVLSLGHWRCEEEACKEYTSLCKVTDELAVIPYCKLDSCSPHFCDKKSIYQMLSFNMSKISPPTKSLVHLMKNCILDYQCAYHPKAVLHKNLISSIVKLEEWLQWERVSCSDLEYPDWETCRLRMVPDYFSFLPLTGLRCGAQGFFEMSHFMLHVKEAKFSVLYGSNLEIELISLCNRIVCCILLALDNIKDNLSVKYSQYVNKTLRSRQRETYRRQLSAVPTIVLNCYATCQLVYTHFVLVDYLLSTKTSVTNVLKTLRKILKLQENIVSQTNVNVNRWDEALKNSNDNIANIKKDYGK
ncbi:endoplasmic reticulum membrane-associated RNA degradation protein-like isoform X2 [Macrobrachium rosenbergii]|uniref:endoplasmic reticulum membrane-associated RNA degradation protein-like isoform X2 n=1 Tax=Macrobrachium rosenbergii TaxID=79674 RepID=UPI0034D60CD5